MILAEQEKQSIIIVSYLHEGLRPLNGTWVLGDSTEILSEVVAALNTFLRGFNLAHTRLSTLDTLMSVTFTHHSVEPVTLVPDSHVRAAHIYVPLIYGNDFSIPVKAIEVDGTRHTSVIQIEGHVLVAACPYFFYRDRSRIDWHHHTLVRTKKR